MSEDTWEKFAVLGQEWLFVLQCPGWFGNPDLFAAFLICNTAEAKQL